MSAEYCTAKDISDFLMLRKDDERDVVADSSGTTVYAGKSAAYVSAGDIILIWDDDNPGGELATVASVSGTTITLTEALTNTYSVSKNAKFQIQSAFTTRSYPTKAEVETLIERAEREIDRATHTSWKQNGRVFQEWKTVAQRASYRISTMIYVPFFRNDVRYNVALTHYPILKLDADKGDQLILVTADGTTNVLNDSDYKIWYVDETTDPRNAGDYNIWIDRIAGRLYFLSDFPEMGEKKVFVKYRFSEYNIHEGLPEDIKLAAMLKVAAWLIQNNRYYLRLPSADDSGALKVREQINNLLDEYDEIIARNRRILGYVGEE